MLIGGEVGREGGREGGRERKKNSVATESVTTYSDELLIVWHLRARQALNRTSTILRARLCDLCARLRGARTFSLT